jgi:MoaA/NifB/PqqE/SkfB family radical SAM enzyme
MNKEIYKLDLALTTACNHECRYCFVDKTGEVMPLSVAKRAIDLLLASPGRRKLLILYGGEPLLEFALLTGVVRYARAQGSRRDKELIISLGTNGTLCEERHLEFFLRYRVKVALSLDGPGLVHDVNRRMKGARSSFARISRKFSLLHKYLPPQDLCVLCGVDPRFAGRLAGIYEFIVSQGFTAVNFEPLVGVPWDRASLRAFARGLSEVAGWQLTQISSGKFYFLNSVSRLLAGDRFNYLCPWKRCLEVYPSGVMSFSPFLINSPERKRYIIGNVLDGMPARYAGCVYSPRRRACQECWPGFVPAAYNPAPAYLLRNRVSSRMATLVRACAAEHGAFRRYVREARKRVFE